MSSSARRDRLDLRVAATAILSAGAFALGVVANWTNALAIVHELCHAAVALLLGAKTVYVEWSVMYTSNPSAWITYAGWWGELGVYTAFTFALAAARRPALAAFGVGALIPPLILAPTSLDFTAYALEAIPEAAAQVVTVAFVVVWCIAFSASAVAYGLSVYDRLGGRLE